MGSGRQGSPAAGAVENPSGLAAAGRRGGMGSSMQHRLDREELLDGGSSAMALDFTNALQGATRMLSPRRKARTGTPLQSPRTGTPLQSPRSMSPLHSPRGEPAPIDTIDFQEAIQRGNSLPKSATMVRHEDVQLKEDGPAIARRSRSDMEEGRHRSPFGSRRFKADAVPMEEEAHRCKAEAGDAAQEKALALAPSWAVRERGRSPRRVKVEVQEGVELLAEKKRSKSSSRKVRGEVQDDVVLQEGDAGVEGKSRSTRRSHSRPHTRQHKSKDPDPAPNLPLALPQSFPPERAMLLPPESHPPPPERPVRSSSRRAAREETQSLQSSDWLQFAVDIIMWRYIPRSALLFGLGSFCILSASAMQDMEHSAITILAYLAILYLAGVFFHRTFFHGAKSETDLISFSYEMSESDVLKLVRLVLPAINVVLSKFSELFSGEPTITLKVAAALWLLAQAGYIMTFWTLARLVYLAIFIIPKCYSCYYSQLYGHAQNLLLWSWTTWNACSHKKAIVIGALIMAWNFSSLSTRICGAFALFVGLRAYRQFFKFEQDELNVGVQFEGDKTSGVNWAISHGLQLMNTATQALNTTQDSLAISRPAQCW